jgi:hypothetical protein
MKDPKRLISGAGTYIERALLQAGRSPPPRGARRRALLAASAAATTSLTAGGAAAEGGVAMAKAGSVVALKWIGVITVTSVGIAGSAAALHGASAHEIRAMFGQHSLWAGGPHRAPLAAKVAVSGNESAAARPIPATAPEPTEARGPLPNPPGPAAVALEPALEVPEPAAASTPPTNDALAASPTTATSPRALARSTTAHPGAAARPGTAWQAASGSAESQPGAGSTLHPELAVLDRARSALAAQDTAAALAILDAYDVRYPDGEMAPEATVLRIEALRKMGNMDAASRTAKRFLDRNPRSPYAARIESLLSHP